MHTTTTFLASVLLLAGPQVERADAQAPKGIFVNNCVVALISDVRVPARESGVLVALEKKGRFVNEDDVLGQIDDSDAQLRKVIAENELRVAEENANSDANVKAAEATIGVAEAEHDGAKEIAGRVPDAISKFEVRRLGLTHLRSIYQAANAKVEHAVNQHTKSMRVAQLQAVENEIARRKIQSPLKGVVEERFHNEGEWVQAGQPVYRVVDMDHLRVEGMLRAEDVMPAQIEGSSVKIEVRTSEGTVPLEAKIDFVSKLVDPAGEYLIHAEIQNTFNEATRQWAVQPGLDATMNITVKPLVSARDNR